MLNLNTRPRFEFDHVLAITTFLLAVFGLVMISSVSVYESYQVYVKQGIDCGAISANCNDFYFWRQARNIAVALPFWIIASSIPYLFWRKLAPPLFVGSIVLLIMLFIPGLSTSYGTSQSWLAIPILNSIQPVELAKLGLIFYLARWMEGRRDAIATLENGFTPFAVILGIIAILLILQPDFGGTLVVTLIATGIYYAAGARPKHILVGGLIAAILAVLAVNVLGLDYVKNRFTAFLDPSLDPEGIGFQVKQSLIAVGKGGFFGAGMEGATQRFGYLPEAQSDAIYAATAEAFGFFGSVILAGLFLLVAYRGFKIASKAPDRFGQLAAVGLSCAIAGQAFIHIGVNIAMLPYTGITLPLVSYGGSSMVASFISAGILLNISKYSNTNSSSFYRENNPRRRI
ncbi:MAG: putative peptidoglycan glycosyltransferase FtsW [Candidatus Gracilibacteria bacterium]|nr:putative peptidoglycan glycosyltransferase FtsW [Candidatus Gracilibacteria bacterium]MDD5179066.1 putative peptidoglycan glycosyltransferase FtsW [Candidatus Gracilibacteria bacterium]